jgi:hypothetical protein
MNVFSAIYLQLCSRHIICCFKSPWIWPITPTELAAQSSHDFLSECLLQSQWSKPKNASTKFGGYLGMLSNASSQAVVPAISVMLKAPTAADNPQLRPDD